MKLLPILFIILFAQACLEEESVRAGQADITQYSRTPDAVATPEPEPEPEVPKRPEGEVYVQRDVCACELRQAVIDGNCLAYCSTRNDEQATLYGSVKLGPTVDLMFGNLKDWCTKSIDADTDIGPNCYLRLQSENHSLELPVDIDAGSNNFSSNIFTTRKGEIYIAKIVVINEEGFQAESDSFQFMKKDPIDDTLRPQGVLKVAPISRYNCLFRAIRADASGVHEEASHVGRVNFFFPAQDEPPIIPYASAGERFYYCHDVGTYPIRDSSAYPRLGLEQHYLTLWDKSDLRFYETMSEGKLDINTLIEQRLKSEYNVDATINLFAPFSWPNYPLAGSTVMQGFYMVPWSDPVTGRTFCPKEADYNSDRPEFRVLKEFLGQDTEGLFFAMKDPEFIENEDHQQVEVPPDYLLMREGLLEKVWFYYESTGISTRRIVPADQTTANRETLHFFWPVIFNELTGEPEAPFIQKSTQRIYTIVRDTADVTSVGSTSDGNRTQIPTSDKRFGCIPVTQP